MKSVRSLCLALMAGLAIAASFPASAKEKEIQIFTPASAASTNFPATVSTIPNDFNTVNVTAAGAKELSFDHKAAGSKKIFTVKRDGDANLVFLVGDKGLGLKYYVGTRGLVGGEALHIHYIGGAANASYTSGLANGANKPDFGIGIKYTKYGAGASQQAAGKNLPTAWASMA